MINMRFCYSDIYDILKIRICQGVTIMKNKLPFLKYLLALLMFGTNGIVASHISLSSYEIVLLRTLIGSLFLIVIFFLTGGKLSFYKHKKQSAFLAVSGIAMGASWIFLYEAYSQIGVSISSLLYYCGPVIVMVLSPLLFKERLTLPKITGFIAVLAGIFLVNGNISGQLNKWGILCGLMSAVMYAFMVICNKKATDITGLENSMLQLFVSFLTAAVFVGIKQGYVIDVQPDSIVPIVILGLVNTGIGCYFYFSSIGKLPVQTVAVCGYLEPLSAVMFSAIMLDERLTVLQLIGAALIIGGAMLGELYKSSPKSST